MKQLCKTDINALCKLQRHGELIRNEQGFAYGCALAPNMISTSVILKLEKLGHCRIDTVGQSFFAVFLKGVDATSGQR